MKSITWLGIIAGGLLILQSTAWGSVLYTNDFGTDTQYNGMTWSTLSGSGVNSLTNETTTLSDMDGDGLVRQIAEASTAGASRGTKVIYAPAFNKIGNFTVSGWGKGNWSNQYSGAFWKLSDDGISYDYQVTTDNSNALKSYAVSSGLDPAYSNVTRVWAATDIYSGSGSVPPSYYGRSGNFKVEGNVANGIIGDRVYIHLNDFGTQAQRDAWTINNVNGLAFDSTPNVDDNNDNLGATVRSAAAGTYTLIMKINAPSGMAFKNPIATGMGYGALTNYGSYAKIQLSRDGTNWNVSSTPPGTVGWYSMTADSTGMTGYGGPLTSIYLKITMYSWTATCLPQAKAVQVTAEIVGILDASKIGLYGWTSQPNNIDIAHHKIASTGSSGVSSGLLNIAEVLAVKSTLQESIQTLDPILNQLDLANINVLVLGEEHITSQNAILDGLYDHIKNIYPTAPPVYLWMTPMQQTPNMAVKADGYFMDSYGKDGPVFRKYLMKHLLTGKPVLNYIWASPAGGGFGGWDEMHASSQAQVDVCREFNVPMFFFAVDWSVGGGSVGAWLASSNPAIVVWRDWYYQVKANANAIDTRTLPAATANHSDGDDLKIAGNETNNYQYVDDFTDEKFIDRATIDGFLNLRWDYANGRLIIEPKPTTANVANQVQLLYTFFADTDISQISLFLSGDIRGAGTQISMALSTDNIRWTNVSTQSGPVRPAHLT